MLYVLVKSYTNDALSYWTSYTTWIQLRKGCCGHDKTGTSFYECPLPIINPPSHALPCACASICRWMRVCATIIFQSSRSASGRERGS
jgi:hypothetical protein